jgi:hypothetical protein
MQAIQKKLERLKIGSPTTYENLTVIPLIGERSGTGPDYATLDEAIRGGWAQVTEVSDEGSVPQLKFTNSGDRAVLMMDGEELVGAKQNRILNLTILAPAGATLIIPVSCVEQGRWERTTRGFGVSEQALFAEARVRKSRQVSCRMAAGAEHLTDQGAIWDAIADRQCLVGSSSPTGAMDGMYQHRRRDIDDFVRAFRASDDQAGAIFAISGRLIGLDLFEHPAILRQMFVKLVRSYALDAIDGMRGEHQELPSQEVSRFLGDVASAGTQSYPSVGLGRDVRIEGERVTGGALVLDERLIHLSAFRAESRSGNTFGDRVASLLRPSRRRNRRQG